MKYSFIIVDRLLVDLWLIHPSAGVGSPPRRYLLHVFRGSFDISFYASKEHILANLQLKIRVSTSTFYNRAQHVNDDCFICHIYQDLIMSTSVIYEHFINHTCPVVQWLLRLDLSSFLCKVDKWGLLSLARQVNLSSLLLIRTDGKWTGQVYRSRADQAICTMAGKMVVSPQHSTRSIEEFRKYRLVHQERVKKVQQLDHICSLM